MKNMLIALPEELHRTMKSEAAKAGMTMKDFITDAIRVAVKTGGTKKK